MSDELRGYQLLYMELCTGGDLLNYLRRRRSLDEPIAKLFMFQIIRALGYLHEKDIVHRDIKLENILLTNLGEIKLCDFGVAEVLEYHLVKKKIKKEKEEEQGENTPTSPNINEAHQLIYRGTGETVQSVYEEIEVRKAIKLKDCCGTPAYMAPEVVSTGYQQRIANKIENRKDRKKAQLAIKGYGKQCDIWSAGVLLYALIFGILPFRGVTVKEIKNKIVLSYREQKTGRIK